MKQVAEIVFNQCMNLKSEESALIIFDKNKKSIADVFFDAAKKITRNSFIVEMPIAKVNGEEPPSNIAEEMLKHNVILLITTMSLSHTEARRNAKKAGVRIASMPGITEEIVKRALAVDYDEMGKVADRIISRLKGKKTLRIKTEAGTDITIPNKELLKDNGLYHNKGDFGNLPAGEVGFAPEEGKVNGRYVVDLTMAGIGRLNEKIIFSVKDGFVTEIKGGDEAVKLKNMLAELNNKSVYNIAEFAIGTNKKAKISGITLEDEKVFGTIHIAIGNNMSYPGGKTNAPIHLDGVIDRPTIIADGEIVMKDGILI